MPTTPGRPRWPALPAQRFDPGAGAGGRAHAVPAAGRGTAWAGRQRAVDGARGRLLRHLPHNLLVGLFAPVFLFAVLALGLGVRRFWRDVTPATSGAAERARHGRGHRRRAAPRVPGRRPWRRLPQRRRRMPTPCRRRACTTSRSTVSCCVLPPPAWPRCTTTCWTCPHRTTCPVCPNCWAALAA